VDNRLGEHGLTDSQCVALASFARDEVLDNRAYRTATGVDSRVATAELQDLVARELVTQTGTRRWARYRLSLLAALWAETLSLAEPAARTASTTRRSGDGWRSCAAKDPSNSSAAAHAARSPLPPGAPRITVPALRA
jgi:hypothetical protein